MPRKKSEPVPPAHFNPHVPGIDYGVLDKLVGYGIRRAQIAVNEIFIEALAPWNITPPRFSAMTIISLNRGLKLTQLAKVLGIARSGAVMLVDALEDMGYVERLDQPGDGRAWGLALTRKGQKDLVQITQAVIDQDKVAAQHLSAEEQAWLLKILLKVAHDEG
ncbi:MAG: MarR family transcriptional regulator [Aquabacterium sp.]|nr:MAG: MarR family transcriptional regulator [Aquabacterium sp.]